MRWLLAAGLVLLVPLGGCVMEGSSEDRCSDWQLDESYEQPAEAQVHLRNERADPVCVRLNFAGTDVAKVPLSSVEGGDRGPSAERTITWSQPQLTVRADLWNGEVWVTEAVDLHETPHLEVTVFEDEIRLEALNQPPGSG